MSTNIKIEVDERTADVLQARAAEFGVTVSELVAELVMLDSGPVVIESDGIAELDRRRKKVEERTHNPEQSRRPRAAYLGYGGLSPVPGSIDLEWSDDALADLDRFAALLHDQSAELGAVVAEEIIAKAQVLIQHSKLGRPLSTREEYRQLVLEVVACCRLTSSGRCFGVRLQQYPGRRR